MRLYQLRRLLKENDRTSSPEIPADNQEAIIQLEQFLSEFKTHDDSYELTELEIFKLLKSFPLASSISASLQIILARQYFLSIFVKLHSSKLINNNNFSDIYNLSESKRKMLFDLLCFLPINIPLEALLLENVLKNLKDDSFFFMKDYEKCLKFLYTQPTISQQALNLTHEQADNVHYLYDIYKALAKINCLNDKLVHRLKGKNYYLISKAFELFGKINIAIDENLLDLLFKQSSSVLHSFLDVITMLLQTNCYPDKNILTQLLHKNFAFFADRSLFLRLLASKKMLDLDTFRIVCNCKFYRNLSIFIKMPDISLLKDNVEVMENLANGFLYKSHFDIFFEYLLKANLLDQDTLNWCTQCSRLNNSFSVFDSPRLFDILKLLTQHNIKIDKNKLSSMITLSSSNLNRLYLAVFRLVNNLFLDQEGFNLAFQRISEKLPKVTALKGDKRSRKLTHAKLSELFFGKNTSIYLEHDQVNKKEERYFQGAAKLKKGFISCDTDQPSFAVKIIHRSLGDNAKKEARKEVKFNQLLGRQAFYLFDEKRTKAYAITKWKKGKSLDDHTFNELNISIEDRLQCLISGFKDLDVLHAHYYIHWDIKPQNFILDLKKLTMKLIDFGGIYKKDTLFPDTHQTRIYNDPYSKLNEFSKDVYGMGFVTMSLFPDIFILDLLFDKGRFNVRLRPTQLRIGQQAIIALVNSLMHSEPSKRCTLKDAIQYCTEVRDHLNDVDKVMEISKKNLHRTNITPDDILRSKYRP